VIVFKLGGSLLNSGWLVPCLDKIDRSYASQPIVIVPGGGIFADQVRALQQQFRFDDHAAHHMAILAMQQMALLIKALKPGFVLADSIAGIGSIINNKHTAIWSPTLAELDSAGIKPTWDITSDSLSAWLAESLQTDELVLVKSVTITNNFNVLKLAQEKVVDASFPEFTRQAAFKLSILQAQDFVS
jgi:5-(aminomethyl)-3-furanmethanol phosphate kinase